LIEKTPVSDTAGRLIHQISSHGKKLDLLLVENVRFGGSLDDKSGHMDFYRPAWAVLASRGSFRYNVAAGLTKRCVFHVDHEVFYLGVRQGRPDIGIRQTENPVVVAQMDSEVFKKVQSGQLTVAQGVRIGEIPVMDGFGAALDRCEQIFFSR
jgi:hypothetical protein